jgi:hypothetical protein
VKRIASEMRSLPAPVGGWNARDAVANMKESDAVVLDNFFPMASDVMGRKGYTNHKTGFAAAVESLLVYATSAEKLFACAGTAIYNATAAGAVGTAEVTGLTNSRWQHVNITTAGGSFMYTVNGTDKPLLYDGSTWTAIDNASTPAITGVTTTTLKDVTLHKNRLWFAQENTLTAWYLPTDSVGGTASPLPLSGVAKRGGEIVSIGTWTLDAGEGMDDHWVAITSEGEVIVYKGTDPSSATTWALVGVWHLGSPIGQRCLLKYAGDLLLLCVDGVMPLSRALVADRTTEASITDKIRTAMTSAAVTYGSNFGWQMIHYPKGNMLIINVPTESDGDNPHQYVMNTATGAWCRFKGMDAQCWAIFNDEPYFGGDTTVRKFWDEFSDNGVNINGRALQAFSYFGKRGVLKHFKMSRPIISSTGRPSVRAGINVDFDTSELAGSVTFSPNATAAWDVAVWDVALWSGSLRIIKDWQTMGRVGMAGAMNMITASQIELHWMASDFLYEPGGFIG